MTDADLRPQNADELRQWAEAVTPPSADLSLAHLMAMSPEDIRKTLHELRVHQIELEMQNEALREAQVELAASRARYFALYDLAPVGYWTLSESGLILQANLTVATLLGTSRGALVKLPLSQFVLKDDQDILYQHRKRLLETGEAQTCELRLVKQDGSAFWGQLTMTVAKDTPNEKSEKGEKAERVCRVTLNDISQRKEMELQLRQAQKMEAIGTLAAGLAHDFNNILGGILGGLSLMGLRLADADENQAVILDLKTQVKRGSDLTRQLLGFARAGQYQVTPLDLALELEKISGLFTRTHPNCSIARDLAPGLRAVLMDRTQLEQVLLNLFINAAQAMPTGGRIRVQGDNAESGSRSGYFIKLVVTDTGIGMDAATQARIFEPFFTTKETGLGTGLGLASAYGIIAKHGGSISVTSEPGKGTSFTLLLPATDRPVAPPVLAPVATTTATNPRGKGTILVVDDEDAMRHAYRMLLRISGYEVLMAEGGRQAIEILREHGQAITLVILDLTMPDMNGSQTFDALRAIAPSLKVLLASGYSVEGQAQKLLARGCKGFIQKPFDAAELSAKMNEILGI